MKKCPVCHRMIRVTESRTYWRHKKYVGPDHLNRSEPRPCEASGRDVDVALEADKRSWHYSGDGSTWARVRMPNDRTQDH